MKNQKMYESIMKQVSKQVLKAIDESFEFEQDELGDKMIQIFNKNEKISKVIKNADLRDYYQLLKTMQEVPTPDAGMAKPVKITNLRTLAVTVLIELRDKAKGIKDLQSSELQDLAKYIFQEMGGNSDNKSKKKPTEKTVLPSEKNDKNDVEGKNENVNESLNEKNDINTARIRRHLEEAQRLAAKTGYNMLSEKLGRLTKDL